MNIFPLGFHVLLAKALLVHSYRLKHPQLKVSSIPKTILLKPTISSDTSAFTTVTSASSNGSNAGHNDTVRPFSIPNTLSLDGKLDCSWPVLGVDLGTQNVGVSFNYDGQFELFKSMKFSSHRQLTARILGLVNYLKERYLLDRLVVGIGFPFLPPSDSASLNGLESADLRMLFQIMYTIDYSYTLSHYLNRVFSQQNNTTETSKGYTTFSSNKPSKASDPNNTVTTRCLYCSIFNSVSTSSTASSIGSTDSIGGLESSQSATATVTHPLCRITGKNCLQTVDLSSMNYLVVGVSEHLSTYQTSSLAAHIDTATNSGVNRGEVGGTSLALDKAKEFLNRDSLSSLNIYYNLLASANSVGSSNYTTTTTERNANNTSDDRSQSRKSTSNTAASNGFSPFLVLPNKTNIFNAKTKHNNILLYRRIKAHLLANGFSE
ncbi:hypothetical protein MACK_002394 [Theileria orientalis]|uniref:Holliday junction resolvase n=1 Tax=Theileria orientalis TaxID=68886 RepID=A0A976MC41_THEOR|nr:hypothetical protein MACK_002394 [Theileria orientalis]